MSDPTDLWMIRGRIGPPERFALANAPALRYRVAMGLTLTSSLLAICVAVGVFAGWRGARPPDPMRGPRLVPWSLIMTLAACAAMVFLVHLLNLLGLKTGSAQGPQ